MLSNSGLHIDHYPNGRWGFNGTIPATCCEIVPAERHHILGNWHTFEIAGKAHVMKPRTFDTLQELRDHVHNAGVNLCDSPQCACRKYD